MSRDECAAACVCGEINTRHCPVHGQGETTAASSSRLTAPSVTDRELLDAILRRALDERFNVNHVTRWLELAVEVNAGNRDMFPNEIKEALRGR